jgi:restriction system protein
VEALIAISSLLYLFWPLILFLGLIGLNKRALSFADKVRGYIFRVFFAWALWVVFWCVIHFQDRNPILLLPEMLNNILFLALGVLSGGFVIFSLVRKWRNRWIRLADAQKIEDLLALTPEEFEALVAGLFRAYGHQAEAMGGISDHGIDVVVQSNQGEKWIVQCKRYSGSVGEPVIRDLYGTMLHEEAQKAYLVTTGSFTNQAITWAEGKPIILYDGETLVKLIRRTQKRQPKLRR